MSQNLSSAEVVIGALRVNIEETLILIWATLKKGKIMLNETRKYFKIMKLRNCHS